MPDEKAMMRLSQAAEQAGVSRQTLQYYLMIGVVEPAGYSPAGQRLFDQASLARIRLVRQLNESGYPLREIRDIFLKKESKKES